MLPLCVEGNLNKPKNLFLSLTLSLSLSPAVQEEPGADVQCGGPGLRHHGDGDAPQALSSHGAGGGAPGP